ncbi:hypothetical protein GF357_02035 [Candidatus Dojkabacteria bacterium]|nr:hypothetical protein [Candidatus Dojkabacteria bacterium]
MRKPFVALLILAVLGIAVWVGFSIYFALTSIDEDPEVEIYAAPIKSSFNIEEISDTNSRIKENLIVQPEVFLDLED